MKGEEQIGRGKKEREEGKKEERERRREGENGNEHKLSEQEEGVDLRKVEGGEWIWSRYA